MRAITTPIVVIRSGNTRTASTGHKRVSRPWPDTVGLLSFAAERRKRKPKEDMTG
jgi:hypothetical protein